jgi:ribosomal protein S18 acetylase RimI-like enzyme
VHETIPITNLTEKQRRSFSCGVIPLDDYFKQFAKNNHVKNIGKTFALLEDNDVVIGYYTTSMGSIDFLSLPAEFQMRLPKYPIPIARIARLAVDAKKQRQGWGEFLLVDALHRIRDAASLVAAFGVVVDAKDEKAKAFYMQFGFTTFSDNNLCLFLPIASIPNLK